MTIQKIIIPLWTRVYRRWLHNPWRPERPDRVIRVKGWRTALIERCNGERATISPCFWIFQ